ncbi:flavodoxin [Anaerobium acetethylicum]|uniref:Flavodoxin n=1 Tax=Anaerobium acetethylicum TaxID=1619234 RepID=A0A1D3TPL5_9FIRM|nr:flavodoxin [Anaerobium acetethylicum]SCP95392.1 Flavodoxin [Anaerobium acetethylicum]
MNKKSVKILVVLLILVCVGGGFYYFTHRGSVGLDSDIVSEDYKVAKIGMDGKRVLVVYFSESGNTQKLAKTISDQVGGDFRRIEPVKPYPEGQELFDYTEAERDNDERPEFKDLDVNMDDYDVVFVGYPIWWYTLPMMMYTFFDEYDFSGKTIIPFNTHEGSGDGGTYSTIKNFEPDATVLDGLAIRGGDMQSDQTEAVIKWLDEVVH